MNEKPTVTDRDKPQAWLRLFAISYLVIQSIGALLWWVVLICWPASRSYFKTSDAPDSSLLAFLIADLLLFSGFSAAGAFGIGKHRDWARPVLWMHAGAAGYAGLYCWTLVAISGEAILGALLMTPALIVPGFIVWKLCPSGSRAC